MFLLVNHTVIELDMVYHENRNILPYSTIIQTYREY